MPIDPVTKRSDLDVLSTTPLASWRGVPFVCGPCRISFSQQHAVHTYPDRDAGYVESTGRNNVTYSFTAIFRRGVVGEGGGRSAFPDQFRAFLAACADRTAGTLSHPLLGDIKAKVQQCDVAWDVNRRDGAEVEVTFIEAPDREDEFSALLANPSLIGSAYDGARSFDSAYPNLTPSPPALPENMKPSLLDSIKQISGLISQTRLGVGNLVSKINGLAFAVSDLADTIAGADDPKNHPAIAALEKVFASLIKLGQEVQKRSRPFRPVILPRPMSLPEAAAQYSTPVADMCRLNPLAAGLDVLPSGYQVFVYV